MIKYFIPEKFRFPFWTVISFLLLIPGFVWSQNPQYYATGGTTANIFPFSSASSNRCQFLILNSELSGMNPPMAGLITHIYFRAGSDETALTTYTDLNIDLGNTTITALPSGPWLTGLTNTLAASTYTIPTLVVDGEWVQFTLTTPFMYDGTSNILIDVSQDGYTNGFSIEQSSITDRRKYGSATSTSPTTGSGRPDFGFDLIPAISCDDPSITFPTAVNATADFDTACSGESIGLNLDDQMPPSSGITYQWQSAPAATGPWTDLDTPRMYPGYTAVNVTAGSYFRAEIYCNNTLMLTSAAVGVVIVEPAVVSVRDSFRCGAGTVFLGAEASVNSSLRWYPDDTTTTPIGSGPLFETPYITDTDTFYVSSGVDTGALEMDCETSREMVIATILPIPDLDLGNDINICVDKGEYIMLNAGVHPYDPQYLWDDHSTSQILAIDTSGYHYVTVTNSYNCSSSDSIDVILRNNPDVDLGRDTSVCKGAEVTLHAGSDGINYFWNTGAIDSVITVRDSGSYNVIVTNSQGCTQSDTIVVHMNGELPVVQGVVVDNLGPYTFRFEAFNPQNVTGYEWDFGDGSPFSYEDAPVHTYAEEGNYIVMLRVNSSCGFWSDVVSANVVAVKDVDPGKEALLVYPNPANGEAKIVNKRMDLRMEHIALYDAMGREVYKQVADNEADHMLNLRSLPPGIYTLKIQMDKGFVYRKLQVYK